MIHWSCICGLTCTEGNRNGDLHHPLNACDFLLLCVDVFRRKLKCSHCSDGIVCLKMTASSLKYDSKQRLTSCRKRQKSLMSSKGPTFDILSDFVVIAVLSSNRPHLSSDGCLDDKGKITTTVLCCIVYSHTNSSYR